MLKSIISRLREIKETQGRVFGLGFMPTKEYHFEMMKVSDFTLFVNESQQTVTNDRGSGSVLEITHDIKIFAAFPVPAHDERAEACHDFFLRFRDVLIQELWKFKPTDDCGNCQNYNSGMIYDQSETISLFNGALYHMYTFKLTETIHRSQLVNSDRNPIQLKINFATNY